ncbi:hypothetical protein PG994_006139 [Apiospora phragmitis]|uniref:C2H2-type domain-containing protein n=1 Tax=Apiospora phragmitis TaxID=2905665 RepID=A0ABR1VE65_9PEZI
MDNNDFCYQHQTPAYGYHPGQPSGDAASYSPTAPSSRMSRGNSTNSYHSTSSSGSSQYPEVHASPLTEEMACPDDNAGYIGYSHSYPPQGLKNEDDGVQNYVASPTTSLPPTSPPEDLVPRSEPAPAGLPEGHICLYTQCEARPFKRKADLDRHWQHVHQPPEKKSTYYCDYSKCSRYSEPFHRMDHCRDHLREYHKEDLIRKNGKEDDEWYRNRKVSSKWFRCTKCLRRNQIKESAWTCLDCSTPCDKKRQKLRAR